MNQNTLIVLAILIVETVFGLLLYRKYQSHDLSGKNALRIFVGTNCLVLAPVVAKLALKI